MTDYRIDVKIDPSGSRSGRRQVEGDLGAIENRANRTRNALLRMVPAAAIGAALGRATSDAMNFGDAMAEVSTLLDDVEGNLRQLEEAALDQAAAFGSDPVAQARAQYQIISAGASNAAEATEILTAANRLAVGGVTDVATAADGLTSVLNAYGDQVESASDVSDILFVGMRAGKTTIGELSASLGKVAPFAAKAGVDFDQLVGATAALTKGGISTNESITGLRAILAAVVKPTEEAGREAERLGLNFSAAALQSEGLAGFLQDVVEKTGGSSESLAQLFGGVEALVPVLALAGQAGVDFNAIMAQMEQRAGATDEAFARISESEGFQFRQQMAALTVEGIRLGNVLLGVIVPAMQFAAANGTLIKAAIVGATAAFIAYRAGLIIATIANAAHTGSLVLMGATISTVARQVGVFAAVQVAAAGASAVATAGIRALTAAMLANPVTAIAVGIAFLVSSLYLLTSTTDDAANATLAKAEADRIAAERAANRATIIGELVAMTQQERAETEAAARAAYGKAVADQQAAYQALQRAKAERELTASMARGAISQRALSGPTSASLADTGNLAEQRALRAETQEVARLTAEFEEAEAQAARLGQTLNDIQNFTVPQVAAPVAVSPVSSASTAALRDASEAAKEARTTFADLEAGLEREIELSNLSGVARDIRAEQLRAEADLERDLTSAENDRIASMLREIESNESRIAAQEDYTDGVNRAIGSLERDNVLLRTNIEERGIRATILGLEAELNTRLLPQDRQRIANLYLENEALADQNRLYDRVKGDLPEIIREREALNALYAQGRVTLEEYNRALFDLNLDEINDRIDRGAGSLSDGFISELARMSEAARNWKAEVGGLMGQFVSDFSQGIGDSFARAIVFSENLGASIKNVAQSALASLISGLIQMGIQILINKAIVAAFGAATVATTATQASAIAAAWAPAAALASLATLGGNAGPAIGGIAVTLASTKALSALSNGFEEGGYTGDGGRSAPAGIVHGQEFVVNADATRRNRPILEAMNAGAGPVGGAPAALGGPSLKITIEDQIGARFETKRISENEVRIIARQEADNSLKENLGPGIAAEMGKPSSKARKAMKDNFDIRPRR